MSGNSHRACLLVTVLALMSCVNLVESGGGLFFGSHPKRLTLVNFYQWENLEGKPKQVILNKNKCLNVPSIETARSIWASDCIMVYKKDWCWGEGRRVAGRVAELRTQGFYGGVASVKPCENNIYIKFSSNKNGWHH